MISPEKTVELSVTKVDNVRMVQASSIKKKTLHLPQDKLSAVKSFFGVATEREAVLLSLEEVLWRKRLQEFLSERPLKGFALTQRELSRMRRE